MEQISQLAEQGDAETQYSLSLMYYLASTMTPSQIAEAQKGARVEADERADEESITHKN